MTTQTGRAPAGLRVSGQRSIRAAMVCCGLLLCATGRPAFAQTNLQLWGDLSLNWLRSDRLSYALDLEPQGIDLGTPVVEAIGAEAKSRFTGRIPKVTVEVK